MEFARPARQLATLLAASALMAGPAALSASASARPAG